MSGKVKAWIGANDRWNEGHWKWDRTGDNALSYDYLWFLNEPNDWGSAGEDCAEFKWQGHANDVDCNKKIGYFCQSI